MMTYKYSILFIGIVVGSEVIFKCFRHVYNVLHHKSSKLLERIKNSGDVKKQRIINKVIFFPDRGILTRLTDINSFIRQDFLTSEIDPGNQDQDSSDKCHLITKLSCCNENTVPHSSYLKRSTSLIHIVNALNSAKYSLKVCVYVITLQDLLDAIIRAKNRGVYVKVIVEGQMPNENALTILRKNNIATLINHSSKLMHHKFALVDIPSPNYQEVIPRNPTPTRIHEGNFLSRFNAPWSFRSFSFGGLSTSESPEPLLLTGSFNWTWTAVVNNSENVIISNDLNLINHYSEEFDLLWKKLQAPKHN